MINTTNATKNNKQIATWLLIGVGMIVIQVLLGGITRLTESGLSITEWKPITGALPPLNNAQWQAAFERYKLTDQFKYIHQNFLLHDFKLIFFWEWLHRLWARLLGVVFLIGFIYFLLSKKFNKQMILPMALLFLLGALQGAIGWIMVQSGLVPQKYFVGHIQLATHFIAAVGLLSYTLWFALSLLIKPNQKKFFPQLKKYTIFILCILFLQLIYGAFMAGLKAAITAPTWPSINGNFIPASITELKPWIKNLTSNNITIQFIHRGLAYVILIVIVFWWLKAKNIFSNNLFSKLRVLLMLLVFIQIILGITTVLHATNNNLLIIFGVLHQFVAMLLLITVVTILFVLQKKVA